MVHRAHPGTFRAVSQLFVDAGIVFRATAGLGRALPAGSICRADPGLRKWNYIVLGLVSLLLVPLALNRLDTFSSNLKLWDDAGKLVGGRTGGFGIGSVF